MKVLKNTLYITSEGAYLSKDHQTLRVKLDGQVKLTVPRHHLEGIVCFGRVLVSPAVIETCGQEGIGLSFHSSDGRFHARVVGPAHGNVLLRRAQYRLADAPEACLRLARPIIAAKIQNARSLLLRAARETEDATDADALRKAATHMAAVLAGLPAAASLDAARGIEGETARTYFEALPHAVRWQRDVFANIGRSRRPPKDPANAMLSFLYGMLRHDATGALEGVGLDPAVGFLHGDRPGRLSLALDLMEEFRPLVADRLVLALVNRRQVKPEEFAIDPGGGVRLADSARRTILRGYQERKREEVRHPLLEEEVSIGLLPHVQARLLARTIRGEYDEYPALVLR